MADPRDLLLGEFQRTLDERFRLSIPPELAEPLGEGMDLILAKQRVGCLSLWPAGAWKERLDAGLEVVRSKINAGRLEGRLDQVQMLGRLLSTRHRTVQLAGRGRLLVPEGFREFLQVEAGSEVTVIGAAVCVEIWNPKVWLSYLQRRMPRFRRLFDSLSE